MSDKHESILHKLADSLLDYFDETGAANYIEQIFECKGDSSKSFVLTMQKTEGLTPCEKLAEANEEIKKLQAENAELTKREQKLKSFVDCVSDKYIDTFSIDELAEVDRLLKGDSDE